jgi:hypothetical protein
MSSAGFAWALFILAAVTIGLLTWQYIELKKKYNNCNNAAPGPSASYSSQPTLGGAGILQTAPASAVPVPSGTFNTNVIPLCWDPSINEYVINFYAGKALVQAAFDTGSARFVVATEVSAAPGTQYYNPNSSSAVALTDPRSGQACEFNIAYVSQTDTIRVYHDTVSFPEVTVDTGRLCAETVTAMVSTSAAAPTPLTVDPFPVAAVVSSGQTINVFGMSSVKSSTQITQNGQQQYLLPSCQVTPTPQYEAAIIENFSQYYTSKSADVIWSMMLGTAATTASVTQIAGMVAFGPIQIPCMIPQFTPMVPSLPNANSQLSRTPNRYYVVQVLYAAMGTAGSGLSSFTKLSGFPSYLVVDSGTTNVMLPGPQASANCQTINALHGDSELVIMLQGNVGITYRQADVTYNGGASNVFAVMDENTANVFSTNMDVGILGSTGMRNLYVEFNLTQASIGFAQLYT